MNDYYAIISLAAKADKDDVYRLTRQACLDLYNLLWLRCYLSLDGGKILCWYRAPDAETVRSILRQQRLTNVDVKPAVIQPVLETSASAAVVASVLTVIELGEAKESLDPAVDCLQSAGLQLVRRFTSQTGNQVIVIANRENRPLSQDEIASLGIKFVAAWHCVEIDPTPPQLEQSLTDTHQTQAVPTDNGLQPSLQRDSTPESTSLDFDAIVIGAGMSGLSMLERLLRMGLKVQVLECGADVGGVWYWNCYPGARVDSETYTYGLSFARELVDEWEWKELFSPQPEIEEYFRFLADRFDLRRHIQFNTRVTRATFDPDSCVWRLETAAGAQVSSRFLLAATGSLSAPQWPDYPGIENFAGTCVHTARWPKEGLDCSGKRVAVLGTGATGVQVIQTIAEEVEQLTVFQRTPTYCLPQRNHKLSEQELDEIHRDWDQILRHCRESDNGFIHNFIRQAGQDLSRTERERKFEELWQEPGFAFWLGNFGDLLMNREVNEHACEFVRTKIRARITDPIVMEKLMPTHPFGAKRVPLENGYYEVFNRKNVRLVDLRDDPIERIAPYGIDTCTGKHDVDIIVFATGFDAGTGALTRIDVRGLTGESLAEKWTRGPRTYLGLLVHDFPNLFIINGPQNAAALCNAGRCIEQNVDWIARCIEFMIDQGATQAMPTPAAEMAWTRHVREVASASVIWDMQESWFFGANTPGKARQPNIYAAGARSFRGQCESVAESGYPGLIIR